MLPKNVKFLTVPVELNYYSSLHLQIFISSPFIFQPFIKYSEHSVAGFILTDQYIEL